MARFLSSLGASPRVRLRRKIGWHRGVLGDRMFPSSVDQCIPSMYSLLTALQITKG
jgi:hypothetical protein